MNDWPCRLRCLLARLIGLEVLQGDWEALAALVTALSVVLLPRWRVSCSQHAHSHSRQRGASREDPVNIHIALTLDEDGLIVRGHGLTVRSQRPPVTADILVRMRVNHSQLLEEELLNSPVAKHVLINSLHHGNPLPSHVLHQCIETEVTSEFARSEETPDKVNNANGASPATASTAVDEHWQGLASLTIPDETNHFQQWFHLRGYPMVWPGTVVELTHSPLLFLPILV